VETFWIGIKNKIFYLNNIYFNFSPNILARPLNNKYIKTVIDLCFFYYVFYNLRLFAFVNEVIRLLFIIFLQPSGDMINLDKLKWNQNYLYEYLVVLFLISRLILLFLVVTMAFSSTITCVTEKNNFDLNMTF
jgi:hypothetical protein